METTELRRPKRTRPMPPPEDLTVEQMRTRGQNHPPQSIERIMWLAMAEVCRRLEMFLPEEDE